MMIVSAVILISLYSITCYRVFHGRRIAAIVFTTMLLLIFGWLHHFNTFSVLYMLGALIANVIILLLIKKAHLVKFRDAVFILPLVTLISSAAHFIS